MTMQISNPMMNRRNFLRSLGLFTGAVASLPLLGQVRAFGQTDEQLKVVIVGGGLAGLCTAYELERLGHECVILEAEREHVGGRVRTVRFDNGLYGEAGAMRIPKAHDLTRHYVSEFNLELRPFISSNPMAYAVARGRQVRVGDIGDLGSSYALESNEVGKTPDDLWVESVVQALEALSEDEKRDLFAIQPSTVAVLNLDQKSLGQVWLDAGLSTEAIEYLAVGYALEQFQFTAVTEHLREEIDAIWIDGFDEIAGGMDLLPTAFAQRLQSELRMGCEVFRLEQNGDSGPVAAVYRRGGQVEREEGDVMVCTLPFSVMERIDIAPAFSPGKQRAIRELHYDSSVKTLAVTQRRFWETGDNIYGGGTVTDLITGSTYYPSDNAATQDRAVSEGPGVLLASYTWGDQARRQSALDSAARQALVIDQVSTFHPELAQDGMILQTSTWSWDHNPWSSGAYAFFLPGQHTALHADIIRPEGRIFIAGEHASLNHSWMQGALESALRVVQEITGAQVQTRAKRRS
ncbi:flavin monoamine oxidase family protein [Candidatus Entotheonella palauensis]|uniref:Tryptophan 2-monooxygenase n=1 Tax=Candidatus Entotheonella gemina TaxID=1429439 RepID=W4M8V3_9BACT|nr:FAD-dependent oxidoreductase [Candidatus Entotheonella palauensis]ETX06336.1 MAG: hypothetical protein ETSY2_17735 [Candidatus Entotheonella gemina]